MMHPAACMLAGLCMVLALASVLAQPADSEGASFTTMPEYVQWVSKACGDPDKPKTAECTTLKGKLCGKRDTSEVLCLKSEQGKPEAFFRSASRYTRVTYLVCSLSELKCTTSSETYTGPARSVDPRSIAAWVQYVAKCTSAGAGNKLAPAAECATLSGAHCSRPDVSCSKDAAEIKDSNQKVVLRGDYARGLAFLK